jgi:hypothetical protein
MLPFVNEFTIKEKINRVFKKTQPRISRIISMSKIRRIKNDIAEIFLKQEKPVIDLINKVIVY